MLSRVYRFIIVQASSCVQIFIGKHIQDAFFGHAFGVLVLSATDKNSVASFTEIRYSGDGLIRFNRGESHHGYNSHRHTV